MMMMVALAVVAFVVLMMKMMVINVDEHEEENMFDQLLSAVCTGSVASDWQNTCRFVVKPAGCRCNDLRVF